MGNLFDKLNEIDTNEDNAIESYLKSREFYRAAMNPRFMNGCSYGELALGLPCLRKDMYIGDDYTLRIFINTVDIYYEVETPYRSYETSGRYNPEEYDTVGHISELLDEIVEYVNDIIN